MSQKGYTLHPEHAWGDNDHLHVLIGERPGAPGGAKGQRAFLWMGTTFVGTDFASDSAGITWSDHSDYAITIVYDIYTPSDPLGVPSSHASVRFTWGGASFNPDPTNPTISGDWAAAQSRRATPPSPSPGVRPIILIPGIMGSYLADGGTETWPQTEALTTCGILDEDPNCERRLLAPDAFSAGGTPAYPTTVSRTDGAPLVGGALSVTTESPDYFGYSIQKIQHWYDITAQNAQATGYAVVQPGDDAGLAGCAASMKCFIPVGVDWRLSASANATSVLQVIQHVLAVTGTDRVDILAHSQGGLVAEALVHQPASVGKVYRMVTLGTPFLGAPKLLSVLLYGEPCLFPTGHGATGCLIDPSIIQSLAENYPGAAELNPSADYYKAYVAQQAPLGVGSTLGMTYAQARNIVAQTLAAPPTGSGLTPRDPTLIDSAETFHASVDHWSPIDPGVRLLRMVGFDATQTSADQACASAPCSGASVGVYNPAATAVGIDTTPDNYGVYETTGGSGDGTVPLFSASVRNPTVGFDDSGGAHDIYWCAVSHFGLAWSTPVWQSAAAYFAAASEPSSDALGGACPDGSAGSASTLVP